MFREWSYPLHQDTQKYSPEEDNMATFGILTNYIDNLNTSHSLLFSAYSHHFPGR